MLHCLHLNKRDSNTSRSRQPLNPRMDAYDRAVAMTEHLAATNACTTACPMLPSEHPVTSISGRRRSSPSSWPDSAIQDACLWLTRRTGEQWVQGERWRSWCSASDTGGPWGTGGVGRGQEGDKSPIFGNATLLPRLGKSDSSFFCRGPATRVRETWGKMQPFGWASPFFSSKNQWKSKTKQD
jgi:hypothetical protein